MKKKLKIKKKKRFSFFKIRTYLTNIFNKRYIGSFLLLISIYLLLAFTSFFIQWEYDNSIVHNKNWNEVITDTSTSAKNILGKFGALIAHQLIYLWFGITAYLIPIFLLLSAIRFLGV